METFAAAPDRPRSPEPLLPLPLLGPASFIWLWVVPVAVMGLLNLQGYWLIGSEMSQEERGRAIALGWATALNLAAGVVVFCLAKFSPRAPDTPAAAHPLWGLPGLLCQVGYLWLAMYSLGEGLLPRNVTAWIYPETRFLFNQFAFCMLPAFHGIMRLAAARAPVSSGRAIAISTGLAIGSPLVLYLVFEAAALLGSGRSNVGGVELFAVLVVAMGVLMFLGLVRALLVVLRLARSWHATGERWAVVILALAMPLAGLTLNIKIPFPVDFQAIEVYGLTAANALVMLFAVWRGEARPRLSWHLLCATFPFGLYFFIVFLPFTPLSVLAVIAMGLGLLVLTPTLLFALHLYLLGTAWRRATAVSSRGRLLLGGALAVLVLPAFFTGRALADKAALQAALDHLYAPTVPGGDIAFSSSVANLRRAVASHRSYKDGIYYPLLSDYYAWLVFDNLVLPDAKVADIERTFLGAQPTDGTIDPFRRNRGGWGRGSVRERTRVRRALPPQGVDAAAPQVRTAAGADGTTVTLAVTLSNPGPADAEYVKTLALPAGVFVNGFRLQVNGTLVPGRIFEKKTALWVYSMIRDTERRDPGMLYYRSPAELELRVYPIQSGKRVTVEIDLLVRASLAAGQLAGDAASLDAVLAGIDRLQTPSMQVTASGDRVVAGLAGRDLAAVERQPYLHLIVDRSANNGFEGDIASVWPELRKKFPGAHQVRLTVANYEVTALRPELAEIGHPPDVSARDLERVMPRSGGLALDLALAHAIRMHRDRDLDGQAATASIPPRPVFVILSRHAAARPLDLPLSAAWADLLPGLDLCELGADASFVSHREEGGHAVPLLRSGSVVRALPSNRLLRFSGGERNAPVQFLASAAGGWQDLVGTTSPAPDSAWSRAVSLQLRQQDHDRNPGGAWDHTRELLKAARESGVLIPSASYIVVENQAQWRMLEKGEQQKLGQNQALEFTETPAPPGLWIGLGFAGWLGLRRWRVRRREKNQRANRGSSAAASRRWAMASAVRPSLCRARPRL